jgi:transposase-like protein
MTTKTMKLVEPSDLVAIHLECKHCGSTLSVVLDKSVSRLPDKCPNCHETWFDIEGRAKKTLTEIIEAHRRLLDNPPRGLTLRIEIANEPTVPKAE